MKPAHQSEQRVSSSEEKLFLSRYSNSPLDDIDADFSIIRPNMPPHWRVAWMLGQEAPGGASAPRAARDDGESHERLRSRKLQHRDDRREDHHHAPGAAAIRTASAVNDELVCSGAPPRSGAERLEVDVDSDTPHLVSRAEPACRPVKRAAGPAAAAEKRSVSDSVGCKQAVCVTILAARLFLCGMNISMYLASFRRYFGAP